MSNSRANQRRVQAAMILACAVSVATPVWAGTSVNPATGGNMVTVSTSGSTAFRNFLSGPGPTLLEPGMPITLNTGPLGAPVNYTAPATQLQLSPIDYNAVDSAESVHAVRFEWHEQGSVEGILEMVNDQQLSAIPNLARNPTNGNPVWVNQNRFPKDAVQTIPATNNNYSLDNFNNGQDPGQSKVQMAFSDVNATQGFAHTGNGVASRSATPGGDGYGLGNPALAGTGTNTGAKNGRQQLVNETVLGTGVGGTGTARLENKTTAIQATLFVANPGSGLGEINRTDAQWLQTAGRLQNGADFNMVSRDVASGTRNVAALTSSVDPSFAVGENDAGNGGNDPLQSGYDANLGTADEQSNIGPRLQFSGKTAGGGQLRPTVQNSRMAVGTLSISDAVNRGLVDRSSNQDYTENDSNRPVRSLRYVDADTDLAGVSGVRANAQAIVDGSYVMYQNQTIVTIKNTATGDGKFTVLGDNSGNDVRDIRDNILNSVGNFPNASTSTAADALINNGYILPSFTLNTKEFNGPGVGSPRPKFNASLTSEQNRERYNQTRSDQFLASSATARFDTGVAEGVTAGTQSFYGNRGNASTPIAGQIAVTANNYLFGDFRRADTVNGTGLGVRDYSDLDVARRAQTALETSGKGNSMFASLTYPGAGTGLLTLNGNNNDPISNLPSEMGFAATKGDLIVMGDFDSDGDFDGEDLRRMARGTSLASSATATTLGSAATFADDVRSSTSVLRKNQALDDLQAATANAAAGSPAEKQRAAASVDGVVSADDVNAFNKFDVNRDGRVSRQDAGIVDSFVGKNYRDLTEQLKAVVATDVNPAGTRFLGDPLSDALTPRKMISLVDVELNDDANGNITSLGTGSDFAKIRIALGTTGSGGLLDGDADFNGDVDFGDLGVLLGNYNIAPGNLKWSQGDFDFNGDVDFGDLGVLLGNYNLTALPGGTTFVIDASALGLGAQEVAILSERGFTVVPEPASLGLLTAAASLLGLGRRGRRRVGAAAGA